VSSVFAGSVCAFVTKYGNRKTYGSKISCKGTEMAVTLERMARKNSPTDLVRIDSEIARDVRLIAPILGMSVPEYLSERLRQIVKRDKAQAAKRLSKEAEEEGAE
jgi:hypothetical protein